MRLFILLKGDCMIALLAIVLEKIGEAFLDAIAASAAASTESLAHIETQLADLAQLLSARFSELIRRFTEGPFSIREQIRDYTRFIQEKTHDFVGRQFVFDAITRFTDTH